MLEFHQANLDRIEHGFLLPNGVIVWGHWPTLDVEPQDALTKENRVDRRVLADIQTKYDNHLRNELGLNRAQINDLPKLAIVQRTKKVYFTDHVEVA